MTDTAAREEAVERVRRLNQVAGWFDERSKLLTIQNEPGDKENAAWAAQAAQDLRLVLSGGEGGRLDAEPRLHVDGSTVAGLRTALAKVDAADMACPARTKAISGKCPKCRADASQPCGPVLSAEYAVVQAVRAALTDPRQPSEARWVRDESGLRGEVLAEDGGVLWVRWPGGNHTSEPASRLTPAPPTGEGGGL